MTIAKPKETIKAPIKVHKHMLDVKSNGTLINAPHSPPYLITEAIRTTLAIRVNIIVIGSTQ